jgi:phosphate-selective porin OprO/OprP
MGASDEQIRKLIERLEAAETRIQELEQLQNQSAPVAKDVDAGASTVAPVSWAADDGDKVDPTIKELTSDWEKKWNAQAKTNSDLKEAFKKSVQSGSSGTKLMKASGRIHMDYWGIPNASPGINLIETGNVNNTPQDRVGFRRMRFGLGGDVNPNVGYQIEMELAGGNNSEFRDVYISAKDLSWLQTVIVGNHKRPYGLDQLNSSRYNVFLERPFVIESFNQDARRLGVSSNGVSDDEAWNWRYGVWTQRLIQNEGNYTSDHLQGEIAGRLANTYWYDKRSGGQHYAHWAISATFAHPDGSTGGDPAAPNFGLTESQNEARFRHRPEARTISRWLDTGRISGADWYEMIGVEKVINFGPLQFVGEYQNLFMQRDTGFRDVHLHGGYVYASYFLTGEHMPWNRKTGTLDRVKPRENFFMIDRCCGGTDTGWGAWQVAARYSYADFNDQDGIPGITNQDVVGGLGESVTLGLNWLWNPNTRLQFNYINGTIRNRNVGGALVGGNYDILGARFSIDF